VIVLHALTEQLPLSVPNGLTLRVVFGAAWASGVAIDVSMARMATSNPKIIKRATLKHVWVFIFSSVIKSDWDGYPI
jgi:hypothetical protein